MDEEDDILNIIKKLTRKRTSSETFTFPIRLYLVP